MADNLFSTLPTAVRHDEIFETILAQPGLRIERIVSNGQASPEGFWYCQTQGEWVVVLQGAAGLQLEGETSERVLRVGDYLHIPAQCRHRVNWTQKEEFTVWLAVHYGQIEP